MADAEQPGRRVQIMGHEKHVQRADRSRAELADHCDRQERHQEPVAREEPQPDGELGMHARFACPGRTWRVRLARQPQEADGQIGHDVGGCVGGKRPPEAEGKQQRGRDGRADDSGRRRGDLGEADRPRPVLLALHHVAGHREPGEAEELAGGVQDEHDQVHGGEPQPDGEVAERDERQPDETRDHRRPDHLGPHHRRLLVPPVHENPGERADQGKRSGRGDQDPADRGGGPSPATRQILGHPQHERRAEDGVPDRRHGLAVPQPRVIPVNQRSLQ
jgi:hypothetical protein